ncbi:MAG: 3-dehydroquinate synthase [Candidatus Omnitrophica bacterium]|nr:3-dehydroquinate synthase [Candidatus Omnitrophota bacterium]
MNAKLTTKTIPVRLKENSHYIHIGKGLFKTIASHIAKLNPGNFGIVITSPNIYAPYHKLILKNFKPGKYKIIQVVDGEAAKSKKWLFEVVEELIRANSWKRRPFIVCLGGGTIGDLGGFVAGIYKRGIPYIQIPTTFLAQIDSSIGGKTAIDSPRVKNILGVIYQPKAVFIDPDFLKTLPLSHFKEGLAEAVKYGVIKDPQLFNFLKTHHKKILQGDPSCILRVITACVAIKAKIVEQDEKETKSLRTILNFGHTFAHALEGSLKYRKISHGQAVALGMVYAANLSFNLGFCSQQPVSQIKEILELFGLPTTIRFNQLKAYQSLVYDKKFLTGRLRMVILEKIGKVRVSEAISPSEIKKTFKVLNRPFIDKYR